MHIEICSVDKRFGAVTAVTGASLTIRAGEILALLGENGAGKSTLMKLLYGIHRPDAGHVEIDGQRVRIGSARDAMALRIGMVFQQFSLIPALSIRENLALATPVSPWWLGFGASRMADIDGPLQALLPEVSAEHRVGDLSVGQMQLVELAKAMRLNARCLILDEPSAVLAPAEAQRLWRLMRTLADQGLAVVLITHKLNDVRACADRVAVMRAGRIVAQVSAQRMVDAQIIDWMVGHQPASQTAPAAPDSAAVTRLEIKSMSAAGARHIDLAVRAGEIVGVAGVSGNGQTQLAEALAGVLPVYHGEVILDGELLRAPRLRVKAAPRLAYIPEQPLRNAVAPELSVQDNLALRRIASLPFVVPRDALGSRARQLISQFDIRPADPLIPAQWLSGGNLQKMVAARELSDAPAAVIACYPTMGLDITACAQIYGSLFELARNGTAVLWISEDLDDLLQHSHRIAVMLGGEIVHVLNTAQTSLAEIGAWMTGAHAARQVQPA